MRCWPAGVFAIHMLRTTGKQGKAVVADLTTELKAVRDELRCLALEMFQQVRNHYRNPDLAPGINNRKRELWLPLLAVASVMCPDRLKELEEAALADTRSELLCEPRDTIFLQAVDKLVVLICSPKLCIPQGSTVLRPMKRNTSHTFQVISFPVGSTMRIGVWEQKLDDVA